MSSPTQELLGGSLSTTGLYNKPISGINIKSVSTVSKNEVNMIKSDNIYFLQTIKPYPCKLV